jgi:hypothetical protein
MKKDPKAFKTGRASFASAVFGNGVDFTDVVFGDSAVFDGAAFGNDTSFNGAAFGWGARFVGTIFKGDVEFMGKPKEQSKRHEGSGTASDSRPDGFLTISFANARFDWEAVFSGRSFEADADFTNARFYYPPDFDAVAKASRIDFTGAHIGFVRPNRLFHWTYKTTIPVRLRAHHDLERDLYIEERKAERGVYWCQWQEVLKKEPNWALKGIALLKLFHAGLWIFVMSLYWILADYGRSLMRPFGALIASGFFFYWCYGKVFEQGAPKLCPLSDQYDHAVGMLALGNTVPFVGPLTIDSDIKKFLFCPSGSCPSPLIPPEGFQFLVIFQNLVRSSSCFSSASLCAIISRSSDGPKRPDFPNAAPASSCSLFFKAESGFRCASCRQSAFWYLMSSVFPVRK